MHMVFLQRPTLAWSGTASHFKQGCYHNAHPVEAASQFMLNSSVLTILLPPKID